MPGSISFLGLGSSQLNADLIDQLRTADEEIILGPVKRNAEKNVAQRTEFGTLAEKVVELKNASNVFSEDLTYLRREVDVSGSAIAVTTVDGVAPQKVAIEVNALAGNHVVQSKGFPNENSFIGLGEDETILVAIGSKEIEINTSPFTRIDGVRDAINDQFQGEIVASILDTGGDEGFRLILKARDSGAENEITFTLKAKESDVSSDSSVESAVEASDNEVKDDNGSKNNNDVKDRDIDETTEDVDDTSVLAVLGFSTVSEPSDASFSFNGIEINRKSNKIEDLIPGVTINLSQEGSGSFEVKQSLDVLAENFETFITTLNETTQLLDTLTNFDQETSTPATFQGESLVVNIRSQITKVLFDFLPDGSSLVDFGLGTNEEGTITFNADQFQTLLSKGGKEVEAFLNGHTKIEEASVFSNAIGYNTTSINEINEDGTISVNTSKKPITSDINISAGSLEINGVKISEINLLASNSPAQNTQEVLAKINAQELETGVRAKLGEDSDRIVLVNASGGAIDINTNSDAESFLGFKTSSARGSSEYVSGIFSNLEGLFDELTDGEFSQLGLLESKLKNTTTSLDEERVKILARLDSKYEIMQNQFAAYNVIIQRFDAQFASLQQQIDFASAKS